MSKKPQNQVTLNTSLTISVSIPFTTPFFWDCECEDDYIHSKAEMVCQVCKCVSFDQPDSRLNEVIEFLVNYRRDSK